MKNKKSVVLILIAVCLLVCGILVWRGVSQQNSDPQGGTVIGDVAILPSGPENSGAQPSDTLPVDGRDPTQEQDEVIEEPVILEDGGDLVIVIPDDQESGGL